MFSFDEYGDIVIGHDVLIFILFDESVEKYKP